MSPNAANTMIPTANSPNPANTVACVEFKPAVTVVSTQDTVAEVLSVRGPHDTAVVLQ